MRTEGSLTGPQRDVLERCADGTLRYHTVLRQWGTGSGAAPYCDGWGEPPLAEELTS